jgi:hypothetical protein
MSKDIIWLLANGQLQAPNMAFFVTDLYALHTNCIVTALEGDITPPSKAVTIQFVWRCSGDSTTIRR